MSESESRSIWREFTNLKKLWPYLRQNKKLVWIAIVTIPIISVLEMNIPIVIKQAIDQGIGQSNWADLKYWVAIYFALVVGQYLCRSAQTVSSALAVHRMIKSLRHALIDHVLRLSCRYHDRELSGRLVTRATSDFDNLSESLNFGVLTSVVDIAVLVGSVIGLFYLNWMLALCTFIIFPVMGLVVSRFSKALKRTMLKARVKIAELNGFTQECFYASSTIKLLTAEKAAQKQYDHLNESYRKVQMNSVMLDAFMFSIIDGLTSITIGLILYAAVTLVADVQIFTAGLMVAFVQYIQQMFEPVKHLSNKIAMLQGAFTAIDRIFGVLEQKDFVVGKESIERLKGKLEFKDVSFSYAKNSTHEADRVLKDVSFTLEPGESLAIVGATGSGKSTIVKLLSKLYDGYSGQILIDDMDLENINGDALRSQIAIVPQDIVLFDGSIRFNIDLGLPGISQDDVIQAAKRVGADQFITRLPGGYDFILREQGANLSHGQRQLIVFARALAKNPSMIILDEATSSVDPQSEAMVQRGIESLLENRTVIVIAHRLATIRKCSQILVLQRGIIQERGNHDTLLEQQGAYHQLYHAMH